MEISQLLDACSGKFSAMSAKVDLEPVGSGKLMPPTYLKEPKSKAKSTDRSHWTEKRVVGGESVNCAVLDSVQSQANRFEEALQQAVDAGEISLPVFRVRFDSHEPITSLSAPHRVYDAWLVHAKLGSQSFRDSEIGKEISTAQPQTATALLRYAPTVLLFGGWDSHVNAKIRFARALASEIVAIGVEAGRRGVSRIDPVNIRLNLASDGKGGYRPASKAESQKEPSKVGLASVAPHFDDAGGGVSAQRIEQTVAISFAQLRRLRFPVNGSYSEAADAAGRAVIAALGIYSVHRAVDGGYALRSGCWLRTKSPFTWRLLGPTPEADADLEITDPKALYLSAVETAAGLGLAVDTKTYDLEPTPGLVEAVRANPSTGTEDQE